VPGNIGATCRAMANFGLHQLRVAAPADDGWRTAPEAVARCAGADALLERARRYDTVVDATTDTHYVVAASARRRATPALDAATAAASLVEASRRGLKTALLFGCERDGLSTEELYCADAVVTLDTDREFSSLNLATSVALLASAWRQADALKPAAPAADDPVALAVAALHRRLEDELRGTVRDSALVSLRRIVARAAPTPGDVSVLHAVLGALVRRDR
jgi:TrmH family RNA methyltransferase